MLISKTIRTAKQYKVKTIIVGRWYCKFWEDGKYHKKYFGRGEKAKISAQDYNLSVKKMKLRGVKITGVNEPKEREKYRFGQLSQLSLDDRINYGRPEKSIYNFKCSMNRYVISLIGKRFCDDITMTDLINMRSCIIKRSRKTSLSLHSVNQYISMVKTVFSWGVLNDFFLFNPWAKYKKPRENPSPPELLTVDEFITVMNCAAPHCKWALDVEFNTGCWPGTTELFNLKFADVIDWKEGKLLIRSTKTKPRVVELRPDFLERLKARHKEAKSDYIIDYNGNPVRKLWKSWKTALRKAGINKKIRM